MFYVLPPVADSMPFHERLERWSQLIMCHPQLTRFNAISFVNDLPDSLEDDLNAIRVFYNEKMEVYKESKFRKEFYESQFFNTNPGSQSGIAESEKKRPDNQRKGCCSLAADNFFSGNWGHIKIIEYMELNNVLKMINFHANHDGRDKKNGVSNADFNYRLREIGEVLEHLIEIFTQVIGVRNLYWQVEDIDRMD